MSWIGDALKSGHYSRMRMVVAYAKEGALLKLQDGLQVFTAAGGEVEAVFGIDQRGTSRQALEFSLATFARSYVWQHPNLLVTFHPKMYLFEGPSRAEAHIGSCNMTVGGLETNCEAAVRLVFDLPAEKAEWAAASAGWAALMAHPNLRPLTAGEIKGLDGAGLLLDETLPAFGGSPKQPKTHAGVVFPATPFVAPSPRKKKAAQPVPATAAAASAAKVTHPSLPSTLLIQIVPHHNGEVFLSMSAVAQYPRFFNFPFKGLTTPKKDNPPYPQRLPDPVTDWTVYDSSGAPLLKVLGFPLNTVYYDKKSELRVTISPQLLATIAADSILQMTRVEDGMTDYSCDVFPPGSPQFASLMQACNQEMPSGGKAVARRFGWV